jgi:hypothetical protein
MLKRLAIVLISTIATSASAADFWAIVDARGKGDDYLHTIDPAHANKTIRRIRCTTSLPQYLEDIAHAADRIQSRVVVRCRGDIKPEPQGERVEHVQILIVCVTPTQNYPLLSEIKGWGQFHNFLPEEASKDPFGKNTQDPFGKD